MNINLIEDAIVLLKKMTDEERKEIFNEFCVFCGSTDPRCHCWNDE